MALTPPAGARLRRGVRELDVRAPQRELLQLLRRRARRPRRQHQRQRGRERPAAERLPVLRLHNGRLPALLSLDAVQPPRRRLAERARPGGRRGVAHESRVQLVDRVVVLRLAPPQAVCADARAAAEARNQAGVGERALQRALAARRRRGGGGASRQQAQTGGRPGGRPGGAEKARRQLSSAQLSSSRGARLFAHSRPGAEQAASSTAPTCARRRRLGVSRRAHVRPGEVGVGVWTTRGARRVESRRGGQEARPGRQLVERVASGTGGRHDATAPVDGAGGQQRRQFTTAVIHRTLALRSHLRAWSGS